MTTKVIVSTFSVAHEFGALNKRKGISHFPFTLYVSSTFLFPPFTQEKFYRIFLLPFSMGFPRLSIVFSHNLDLLCLLLQGLLLRSLSDVLI